MEIKLAIIDDDEEFLTSFAEYASRTVGFAAPATFSNAKAALRSLGRFQYDVILVDLLLGRASGCDLIRDIKQLRPDARVLVLSGFSDDYLVGEAFRLGADGYLLKTQPLKEILASVQSYFTGGVAIDSGVMQTLLQQLRLQHRPASVEKELTPREKTILLQLSTGRSYKEIAQVLGVSTQTIYSHAKRLFRKLGVKSKTEAVVCYLNSQPKTGAESAKPPAGPEA